MKKGSPATGRASAAEEIRGRNEAARGLLERLEREALAWALDGAALHPDLTSGGLADYLERCAEAKIKAVCVLPHHLAEARARIDERGLSLDLCGVVDFPLGFSTADAKEAEAGRLIALGADELDAVMNVGLLKDGREEAVLEELKRLRAVAGARVLKVIIETPLLTDEKKARAAELCLEAGADYVKTATGFRGSTEPDDVRLLREVVGAGMDIKAAGGIRTLQDAALFFEAGANRLGARTAPDIMDRFDARRAGERDVRFL